MAAQFRHYKWHTLGKLYMAPSVKLQVTPSSALNESVTMWARRRRLASSAVLSLLNCSNDASPGLGGFTMHEREICRREEQQAVQDCGEH